MITITHRGRTCNWLHQYVFGRLLAEEMGYCFKYWNAKNADHPISKTIKKYFPQVVNLEGQKIHRPCIHVTDASSKTPISELAIKLKNKGRLHLDGNFEVYGMYNSTQQYYIKQFMQPIQHLEQGDITKDDVVLHYRTGDLFTTKSLNDGFLSFEYFQQILKSYLRNYDRLYIVTEPQSLKHKDLLLNSFKGYKPIIRCSEDYMDDWNFIRLFDKIIISQSSFSWWAALLSNASQIYYPIPYYGTWRDTHLRMIPEDRIIPVEETPYSCIKRHRLVIKYLMRSMRK